MSRSRTSAAANALLELRQVVGERHVLADADDVVGYVRDWTGRFVGTTPAVVRPADASEVADVLTVCRTHGLAVVPQGGNTGLVGGGVPLDGEILLSLARLSAVEEVDELAGQVTAGAGAVLGVVQEIAARVGRELAIDLAARDSATIGGMVATNAGGTRFVRHGPMRAHVLGLEAVFADGTIVRRLGGVLKDNTGYDWPGLLVGSEGTLGVVTRARLRLIPRLPDRVTALVPLDGLAAAVTLATEARDALPGLEAAEVMLAAGVELVCRHAQLPPPPDPGAGAYLLLEVAGHGDLVPALAAIVGERNAAVAEDPHHRAQLWAYRERHTEAVNGLGVPHKLDVTLPLDKLTQFGELVFPTVERVHPGATCIVFGHLGDGNLHVNVVGPAPDDDGVDGAVLELVGALGGSISAEHGIGRAKVPWLHLSRSPEEMSLFRTLKRALDPEGVLNPHVLISGRDS